MIESYWLFTAAPAHGPVCANCNLTPPDGDTATPYCPWCGAHMDNHYWVCCHAYHTGWGRPVCYGTKEREECTCGGDMRKCDFYEEVRERGRTLNG